MKKRFLYPIIFLLGLMSYGQLTCPLVTSLQHGETNVAVNTDMSWNAAEEVLGYILSFGITPGRNNAAKWQGIDSRTTYVPPLGLPQTRISMLL